MKLTRRNPLPILVVTLVTLISIVPSPGLSSLSAPSLEGSPITVGSAPTDIAITPDGSRAYVANYTSNNVSIIDLSTGLVTGELSVGNNPTSIAISPNGTVAYVTNFNDPGNLSTVSRIDLGTGTVSNISHSSLVGPRSVVFSPDGSKAYVSNQGSSTARGTLVTVINAISHTFEREINVPQDPQNMVINSEGTRLFVSHPFLNKVSVIDLTVNNPEGALLIDTGPNSLPGGLALAGTTGSERLYVAERTSGKVTVYNAANGTLVATIAGLSRPETVTPNGPHDSATQLFVANTSGNNVRIIDLADNTLRASSIPVGTSPFAIAFTPNRLTAYVANAGSGNVSALSYYQPRTLSFTTTSYTLPYGGTQTVSASPSAGPGIGTLSYSHGNSTACSVDSASGLVTITQATGTCSISSTITRGGTTTADAYQAASTVTPVSITPAEAAITIAASSDSVDLGSAISPTFSISSGALVSPDSISGVSYTYEGSGSTNYPASSTPPSETGTYSVTPSSAVFATGSLLNYNVTYNPGTLTIRTPPPTASAAGALRSVQLVSPRDVAIIQVIDGFLILPEPSKSRKKFVFAGWSQSQNGGGEIYKVGHRLQVTGNMTLYSTWKPKPARVQTSGFAPNSSVLSDVVKANVKRFLRSVPNEATVFCKGSVASSSLTPSLRVLGQARAKAACDFIKELRPKVTVRSSSSVSYARESKNRSVELTSK